MDINQLKKLAAEKAIEEISSGMTVGLGTGSTVQFALEKISSKIKSGELKNIICIPSSKLTEDEAKRLGIPLTTLNAISGQQSAISNQHPASSIQYPDSFAIDLTIDGADEVDENLNLIKGGGGALLREKILAQASKQLIIIIDESKFSKLLGEKFFVPVEVFQFSMNTEKKFLESLGAKITIRKKTDGEIFITDENNIILDADFGVIKDPVKLSTILNNRAGIVEHGIFIGITGKLICAMKNGEVKIRRTKYE